MRTADAIIIGAGLSGLTAALILANRGNKVTVLSYGSGCFPLQSGAIDLYCGKSPKAAIDNLPKTHPYKKIGSKGIDEAAKFFINLAAKHNLPYVGKLTAQIPIVTAIGTLKYSALAPESMNASRLVGKSKLIVVEVKGLKDFYAAMLIDNLKKYFPDKTFETAQVDLNLLGGRDITTVDVARALDDEEGLSNFIEQLKNFAPTNDAAFIVPPILGLEKSCHQQATNQLGAEIIETTCLPPSPPGLRLRNVFVQALNEAGVKFVENAKVIGSIKSGKNISGVVVETAAREKTYTARRFILATGGFYGGGLTMRDFDDPREPIFDLPVFIPTDAEDWSNKQLFSDKPQGFAKTGIMTDEEFYPVDKSGKKVLGNVQVIGRSLGGFDFTFEHSGNGVALCSAYRAATI